MDTPRGEAQEALLRDIIAEGSDALSSMFLNDNDGLEGEGEEAAGPLLIDLHGSDDPMPVQEEGYVHDGFDPLMPVQEEDYVHDSSGDTMEVQEGDRADCSGDRTESDQLYILVKPVLTS